MGEIQAVSMDMEAVLALIRRKRREMGVSAKELAGIAGMSLRSYREKEAGAVDFRVGELKEVIKKLGMVWVIGEAV